VTQRVRTYEDIFSGEFDYDLQIWWARRHRRPHCHDQGLVHFWFQLPSYDNIRAVLFARFFIPLSTFFRSTKNYFKRHNQNFVHADISDYIAFMDGGAVDGFMVKDSMSKQSFGTITASNPDPDAETTQSRAYYQCRMIPQSLGCTKWAFFYNPCWSYVRLCALNQRVERQYRTESQVQSFSS